MFNLIISFKTRRAVQLKQRGGGGDGWYEDYETLFLSQRLEERCLSNGGLKIQPVLAFSFPSYAAQAFPSHLQSHRRALKIPRHAQRLPVKT